MANVDVSVELKNNRLEVISQMLSQARTGLDAIGLTAVGYAVEDCPVDTGRLMNSIDYAVEDNEVQIGTNVEYAPAVEYLDIEHKTGKAHFLRDAATTHGDEYQAIMEAALRA